MTPPTPPHAAELPPAIRRLEWLMLALWVGAAVAATVQGVDRSNNNFHIFRAASLHLVSGQDLYAAYPALHFDFYKYSPTFAFLFLPFALLPFAVSMLLWNLLNAGSLFLALGMVLPRRAALAARAIVFLDMLGSLQNVQSNALVAALMIAAFAGFERRHAFSAGLAIMTGTIIKLFPLSAASFAVFHPRKPRVALSLLVSMALLLLLPLLVTPAATLLAQYRSWRAIEEKDAVRLGFTVMQMLQHLFRQDWPNWPIQGLGVLALVAPVLVRRDRWTEWGFRRLYLCSVLVFCLIFNHQSESPSFVIGVTGAAIWFAALQQRDRRHWAAFAFLVVCTILASSDAMPKSIQRSLFDAWQFKAVPLIVIWAMLQGELWRTKRVASSE